MNRYIEKTQEILNIIFPFEPNASRNINKTPRDNLRDLSATRRNTITVLDENTYTFARITSHLNDEPDLDELYNNLSRIRDYIREIKVNSNLNLVPKTVFIDKPESEICKTEESKRSQRSIMSKKKFENIIKTTSSKDKDENCHNNISYSKSRQITEFVKEKESSISVNINLYNNNSNIISKCDISKGSIAIIEKVPRLIPEEFFEKCYGCKMNFGVCRWKYHCRCCGYVFCFYCSWNYDNFLPFYLQSVRICDRCITDKKNLVILNM
jgi:hypothetical protein